MEDKTGTILLCCKLQLSNHVVDLAHNIFSASPLLYNWNKIWAACWEQR